MVAGEWRRRVLVALALLLAVAGTPMARAVAADPAPIRVLIVGDSITQGSAGDWTWRYRLWQHLTGNGVAVDLVGPRTDLADNIAQTLGSQDYVDPAFDQDHAARWGMAFGWQDRPIGELVATYRPDVVVELLGVNDLLYGATPDQTDQLLRTFVADARAADPGVDLVVGRVPDTWFPGVPAYNELVTATATELDSPESRVVAAAADTGYDQTADTWDTSHPDAQGEVKIAAAVADALSTLGVGPAFPRPLPVVPLGPRLAPVATGTEADGALSVSWSGSPGSTGEYVWWRDVTTGQAWTRLADPVTDPWTPSGLTNGHRYAVSLQPVKGTHPAAPDVRSQTLLLVPHTRVPFALTAAAGPFGYAHLAWATTGAPSYALELRDATAAGAWRTVRSTGASPATVGNLVSGHRYDVRVRADYVTDQVDSAVATATVPLPRPVRGVRASSPAADTVVAAGTVVPEATAYRLSTAAVRRCARVPAHFVLTRAGLARPAARVTSRASHLWVRLRAVRNGVPGTLAPGSTVCTTVR